MQRSETILFSDLDFRTGFEQYSLQFERYEALLNQLKGSATTAADEIKRTLGLNEENDVDISNALHQLINKDSEFTPDKDLLNQLKKTIADANKIKQTLESMLNEENCLDIYKALFEIIKQDPTNREEAERTLKQHLTNFKFCFLLTYTPNLDFETLAKELQEQAFDPQGQILFQLAQGVILKNALALCDLVILNDLQIQASTANIDLRTTQLCNHVIEYEQCIRALNVNADFIDQLDKSKNEIISPEQKAKLTQQLDYVTNLNELKKTLQAHEATLLTPRPSTPLISHGLHRSTADKKKNPRRMRKTNWEIIMAQAQADLAREEEEFAKAIELSLMLQNGIDTVGSSSQPISDMHHIPSASSLIIPAVSVEADGQTQMADIQTYYNQQLMDASQPPSSEKMEAEENFIHNHSEEEEEQEEDERPQFRGPR